MAGVPRRVLQHFSRIPLFSRVGRRHLAHIVAAADEITVGPGKELIREGSHGRHLYVIVEGKVAIIRGGRRIATLRTGDFFGELALLSGTPRSATVTTDTETTLMVLDPRRFEVVLDEEPGIRKAVMAAMAERLQATERSVKH